MSTEIWFALAATNFAASIAPGQNVAFVSAATTRSGFLGGVASLAGILFAELVWVVLAILFAIGLLEVSPLFIHAMQLAGGCILAYFGFSILREMKFSKMEQAPAFRFTHYAAKGAWIGLANPLALMFFVALFPGFLLELTDNSYATTLMLCVPVILLSSACGLIPWMAATRVLTVHKGIANVVNCVSGTTLLVMGALVFLQLF
ncbi:LysE family translocator [Roseibium aggregatum]|jgi:threonine/homoserine/homoserine lactone efflux protein|uniref:LysE type translocator n=1 Tax=Roseibium aggregatum (strain ATCC 25650 / DSM 13394 / JCM 20685 / NBRC 16684 / NCIMB 2208 / IAM 12614 / B1) TaxID=384765 RepID=A0NZG4_ROSAI|nr:LysE family translocator [Roseibium aggregatum]EAV41843.1 LysE type translocator [Roseibium aggregatum IAM 12614]